MNISKIKQIVSEEGKVLIIDNDDIMVVMSFDEYEKIKSKSTEPAIPVLAEKPEPKPEPQPQPQPELSSALPQPEKPLAELTLDDLPF